MMSCFMSGEEKRQLAHSREIDEALDEERWKMLRSNKCVLLGAKGSGKSTYLKQIQFIYGERFSHDDMRDIKWSIYSNVVKGMRALIDARRRLGIPLAEETNSQNEIFLSSFDGSQQPDDEQFLLCVEPMKQLWQDEGIRSVFDQIGGDSLRYFLEKLDTIGQKNYVPLKADILRASKATEGLNELEINRRGVTFYMTEVGGMTMRGLKKMLDHFEDVRIILILVSCDEFDQVLMEDGQTNRLAESCNLFKTISNNCYCRDVNIVLLMNKMDLLAEKIKHVNIKEYMPDFMGDPHDIDSVKRFLEHYFQSRSNRETETRCYFINALDSDNINHNFDCVLDTLTCQCFKYLYLMQ